MQRSCYASQLKRECACLFGCAYLPAPGSLAIAASYHAASKCIARFDSRFAPHHHAGRTLRQAMCQRNKGANAVSANRGAPDPTGPWGSSAGVTVVGWPAENVWPYMPPNQPAACAAAAAQQVAVEQQQLAGGEMQLLLQLLCSAAGPCPPSLRDPTDDPPAYTKEVAAEPAQPSAGMPAAASQLAPPPLVAPPAPPGCQPAVPPQALVQQLVDHPLGADLATLVQLVQGERDGTAAGRTSRLWLCQVHS